MTCRCDSCDQCKRRHARAERMRQYRAGTILSARSEAINQQLLECDRRLRDHLIRESGPQFQLACFAWHEYAKLYGDSE